MFGGYFGIIPFSIKTYVLGTHASNEYPHVLMVIPKLSSNTLQSLYNTVLDITRFKDGSQKCIDYIEK